jgi:hypothetical protein
MVIKPCRTKFAGFAKLYQISDAWTLLIAKEGILAVADMTPIARLA